MDKVGVTSYVAEPFHVDFTGRLFMSVLGNHLLNSAGFHATDRGFGIANLNESHHTWVLSRLAIELNEMPLQYAHYSISTWIEKVYRLFTDRNFAITGDDGKIYGYARSVWAMIDMESRKPADLLSIHNGTIVDYIDTEESCPIDQPGSIKLPPCEPIGELTMPYSDIAINGHVNSIKYIEHLLNFFPKEQFAKRRIQRFEMAYIAESYYGDKLSFYRHESEYGYEYEFEVKRNAMPGEDSGELVCRCKMVFVDN